MADEPTTEPTTMTEAELREAELRAAFARIVANCTALVDTATEHLAAARACLAAVDRIDELTDVAARLGIYSGPLADLRTRLATLMK